MWMRDAMRFVDVFGKPISKSMPHIYLRALAFAVFAPLTSIMEYTNDDGVIQSLHKLDQRWGRLVGYG